MKRKPQPISDPLLDDAIGSALLHAGPDGATLEQLRVAIGIGFQLDVSTEQIGRAMFGLVLHGAARKLPDREWPTYAYVEVRRPVGSKGAA